MIPLPISDVSIAGGTVELETGRPKAQLAEDGSSSLDLLQLEAVTSLESPPISFFFLFVFCWSRPFQFLCELHLYQRLHLVIFVNGRGSSSIFRVLSIRETNTFIVELEA